MRPVPPLLQHTLPEHRAEEGVPVRDTRRSAIAEAILDGGYRWEERILDEFLAGKVIVGTNGEPGAPVHETRHDTAGTVAALLGAGDGQAVYQGTLRAPASFYAAYGLDPDFVTVVDCYPDLLWVTDAGGGARPEVRVVNTKATDTARLAHRIQVGLYALILDHVLADAGHGRAGCAGPPGGVWLYGHPETGLVRPRSHAAAAGDLSHHGARRAPARPAGRGVLAPVVPLRVVRLVPHPAGPRPRTTADVSLDPGLSSSPSGTWPRDGRRSPPSASWASLLDRPDATAAWQAAPPWRAGTGRCGWQVGRPRSDDTEQPTGAASVAMPQASASHGRDDPPGRSRSRAPSTATPSTVTVRAPTSSAPTAGRP